MKRSNGSGLKKCGGAGTTIATGVGVTVIGVGVAVVGVAGTAVTGATGNRPHHPRVVAGDHRGGDRAEWAARWALAGAGPGFLRGGEQPGPFGGLLNQPSSDGEIDNAVGVVSFRCRRSIGVVAQVGGGAGISSW